MPHTEERSLTPISGTVRGNLQPFLSYNPEFLPSPQETSELNQV